MWPGPRPQTYTPPSPQQVRLILIDEARRNRERAVRLRAEADALDAEAARILASPEVR